MVLTMIQRLDYSVAASWRCFFQFILFLVLKYSCHQENVCHSTQLCSMARKDQVKRAVMSCSVLILAACEMHMSYDHVRSRWKKQQQFQEGNSSIRFWTDERGSSHSDKTLDSNYSIRKISLLHSITQGNAAMKKDEMGGRAAEARPIINCGLCHLPSLELAYLNPNIPS